MTDAAASGRLAGGGGYQYGEKSEAEEIDARSKKDYREGEIN
jgi:hypothetical protein